MFGKPINFSPPFQEVHNKNNKNFLPIFTQRQTETERNRDRQTERQRHREKQRERGRDGERQRQRNRERKRILGEK